MATKRTRAHRGGSGRASGSGALLDTVRNTFGQLTGKDGGSSRGRGGSSRRGGNLPAQASGFIGGLLSGGDNRRRGRRRR